MRFLVILTALLSFDAHAQGLQFSNGTGAASADVTVPTVALESSVSVVAVAAGTFVAIPFDTERVDTDAMHSGSATSATVRTAGVYSITCGVDFQTVGFAATMRVKLVSSVQGILAESTNIYDGSASGVGYPHVDANALALLAVGESVTCQGAQNRGVDVNMIAVGGGSDFRPRFTLAYAGNGGTTGGGAAAFSGAKAYIASDVSIAGAGALAYLSLDAEAYDVGGYHSTTVNPTRMTIPTTGYYVIVGTYHWNDGAGGGHRGAAIRLNGATFIAEEYRVPAAPADTTGSLTGTRLLNAGDYIEFGVLQTTGSARDIYGLGERTTTLSVVLLGT